MPPDSPSLPHQQITIVVKGYQFQLLMPYAPGHQLTEAEAGILNREWTSAVRAGFVGQIEAAIEHSDAGLDHKQIQGLQFSFQHFADEFAFKALSQPRNADPLVRAAHTIAKKVMDIRLNANGISRSDYGDSKYEAAISRLMNRPEVIRQAQAQLDAARDSANELVGLSDG